MRPLIREGGRQRGPIAPVQELGKRSQESRTTQRSRGRHSCEKGRTKWPRSLLDIEYRGAKGGSEAGTDGGEAEREGNRVGGQESWHK